MLVAQPVPESWRDPSSSARLRKGFPENAREQLAAWSAGAQALKQQVACHKPLALLLNVKSLLEVLVYRNMHTDEQNEASPHSALSEARTLLSVRQKRAHAACDRVPMNSNLARNEIQLVWILQMNTESSGTMGSTTPPKK